MATAKETFTELYDACRNPEFCCNHITIEDGNIDNRCIQSCIDWAVEQKHPDCEALARHLLAATVAERLEWLCNLDPERYDEDGEYLS